MAKRRNSGKGRAHVIHPAEFKLQALERMEAGECVSALSRELGVLRQQLYWWRDAYRKRGMAALERRPGRKKVDFEERRHQVHEDATRRIADLERKVGRQALLIDFFQRAFKRVEDSRRKNDEPGAKTSTGRSDA